MSRADELRELAGAARRCSDEIRQHITDGHVGKWAAIRLSDGGSDRVPYDSRADAIFHQLSEQQCCYVKIPEDDMGPAEAASFLRVNRALYAAGHRLIDPDAPEREVMLPQLVEDARWMLRTLGERPPLS